MPVRRTASIDDVRNEKLLYKQAHEHDACGMGFVASIDGKKSHKIVQLAIEGVVNLTHRGAVSADSKSGDGAGITCLLYTSPSPRDRQKSRMPSSA